MVPDKSRAVVGPDIAKLIEEDRRYLALLAAERRATKRVVIDTLHASRETFALLRRVDDAPPHNGF